MKVSDFQYSFPKELIALKPTAKRSEARLMVWNRSSQTLEHKTFADLPDLLNPTDLIVVNSSQVLPARFYGVKKTGGQIEGLYLENISAQKIKVWLKGKVAEGEILEIYGFGNLKVLQREEKAAELEVDAAAFVQFLKKSGEVPVPPYIKIEREKRQQELLALADPKDYQSIFAQTVDPKDYSVAAPTASLHFDQELVQNLKNKGIEFAELQLAVGEGTFAPILEENLDNHQMHSEKVQIAPSEFEKILKAKKENRRVIAIGTTVVRSLESAFQRAAIGERIEEFSTKLFIKPPFQFSAVDAVITNFHWPDSTLMALVATFIEADAQGKCAADLKNHWKKLYETAVHENYRLFSYGDGMLIL
ncbi:MAG: tRNA preQ1(34) S-adenosylmethionine ribosyltransferase-isomerase QueA [Deltaproteobacteria bacterium]|nr:tRNA preQ1(34) S-adenosylmethionine ribosyltransferase-isomerase QueA [Deltaproteobacteria bacterium]